MTTIARAAAQRQHPLPFSEAPEVIALRLQNGDCTDPVVTAIAEKIRSGGDPLGEAFIASRTAQLRRETGTVYTPAEIVAAMIAWAQNAGAPQRVVDPGAGSGRFLLAAARAFPEAQLVAVESDPAAVEILRANLAVCGFADRTVILKQDYRVVALSKINGQTLFLGNPPYVRHHDIEPEWKTWFTRSAGELGHFASQLAGLHIYFFLRTLQLSKEGDYGALITSAEWLDVNYGSILRNLLAGELGGTSLHIIDPRAMPFPDTAATGAITCFKVNSRPKNLRVQTIAKLDELNGLSSGELVPWERAAQLKRWSAIIRPAEKPSSGYIELGELCRVHRGQVTGNNEVWIAGDQARDLPKRFLFSTITRARELIRAVDVLADSSELRRVIDIPADLDEIEPTDLPAVERFLAWARKRAADQSYVAQHRRAWWEVRLKEPAPIVCTYMARRPPAFVRNLCNARHINVAHGLYPRQPLSDKVLNALAAHLRSHVSTDSGRTYAGGLTKFEPRELERVHIPSLELLGST